MKNETRNERDCRYVGCHVSFGNRKLPDTTAIWNCGAAHDCPSKPLGLCQVGKRCYALNTERYMTNALPFRRRQHKIMRTISPSLIAEGILKRCQSREKKVTLFRFGQSGDFYDQKDIETTVVICALLSRNGIECYGFTARTDLDLKSLLKVAHVGVSNDKGGWQERGANRFKVVQVPSGDHLICAEDCTICNICSTIRGKTIEHPRMWCDGQMTFNEVCDYSTDWE